MLPDEHLNCLSWLSTNSFKSNSQSAQSIMSTCCKLVTMTLAIMSTVSKTVKEMCLQHMKLLRCSAVIIKVVHFKCNHSFPKQNKWLTKGKWRSELTRRNEGYPNQRWASLNYVNDRIWHFSNYAYTHILVNTFCGKILLIFPLQKLVLFIILKIYIQQFCYI